MIAIIPAAMMRGARTLYLAARYAAPQIDNAASVFGGTVILIIQSAYVRSLQGSASQLRLPRLEAKLGDDRWLDTSDVS